MNTKSPAYTDINQFLQEPFTIEDNFSAFDCLKEARYLSTGLEELDDLLRGGIPNFGLTEIFGKRFATLHNILNHLISIIL
jgi:hypothetical protein